jgi:formylglycine-generating enzyme required for sulfatase activity
VEGSVFVMGGGVGQKAAQQVTVASFYMGKYEVTQAEWQTVMGTNPSSFIGDKLPVESISWHDAVEYCNKRSLKEGLKPVYSSNGDRINISANGYRLPTEAEWEYAARAYTKSAAVSWHKDNSNDTTHPVGTKPANSFGIYDIMGNVSELTQDGYVYRGTAFNEPYLYLHARQRYQSTPASKSNSLGLRLVRNAPQQETPIPVVKPAAMILVEGGTFTMGSDVDGGFDTERNQPAHQVTVSTFYMSPYEVTQTEWRATMGYNTSYYIGDNLPVEQVSWDEAIRYCNKRSVAEGLQPTYRWLDADNVVLDRSANGYRLPTEAEWEYAARGGNKHEPYSFSGSDDLDAVGWDADNSNRRTQPVGTKAANGLGIYDMTGNVAEWVWDYYEAYSAEVQKDPLGPTSGYLHINRGGSSWPDSSNAIEFREVAEASYIHPGIGLRLVRSRLAPSLVAGKADGDGTQADAEKA